MTTGSQADPQANAPSPGAKRRAERQARRARKAAQNQAASQSAVQAEGLTGAQLRNASRLARRHGLTVADPFEAVEQLRKLGHDPFEPANPLRLVVDNAVRRVEQASIAVAPAKSPAQKADEARHELELARIRAEISRRRAHRATRLGFRLYVWIVVPTLAALFYYSQVATPLYATRAEFLVQTSAGGGGGLGGLLPGLGLGGAPEAVAVQSYILSVEAMQRLDAEHGFVAHFSAEDIDPVTRLGPEATLEDAHKLYTKRVRVGYDPTEGIVRLQVLAADPQTAVAFANVLVGYAEEVVNNLSLRQRQDRLAGARANLRDAEAEVAAARGNVLALQEQRGIVNAEAELGALMAQISAYEMQLGEKRLELAALNDNPQPNTARVGAAERRIAHLTASIDSLRATLTASRPNQSSLAQMSTDLHVAEAALTMREALLQEAVQQLHQAEASAASQVGYLSLNVAPVTPQSAAYPRVATNTALAFLIFTGLYLLVTLTVSVLKEQIAS